MHAVDVGPLRAAIMEDRETLRKLWDKLLPGAILLLYNHHLLELPKFLVEKPFGQAN